MKSCVYGYMINSAANVVEEVSNMHGARRDPPDSYKCTRRRSHSYCWLGECKFRTTAFADCAQGCPFIRYMRGCFMEYGNKPLSTRVERALFLTANTRVEEHALAKFTTCDSPW